jgi:ketopantoate reductase
VNAVAGKGLAEVEANMARDAKSRVGVRPSTPQDVMKGRRTEINYLNGYVSEQGQQGGVKTPLDDEVVQLVNAPGVGLLKPDQKNLDPLWALVPREAEGSQ